MFVINSLIYLPALLIGVVEFFWRRFDLKPIVIARRAAPELD
jgi:hypothetical protein